MALCAMTLGIGVVNVDAAFGTLTDGTHDVATVTLDDYSASAASTATIVFDPDTIIPSGGTIQITIPETFTAGDVVDLTAGGKATLASAGTATIASASLTNKIVTITTGTADIAIDENVTIVLTGVITANAANAGSYGFQVTTKDTDGSVLDTGIVMVNVGDANTTTDGDQVSVTAVVQEAMVMSIEEGAALNFTVNPSVNNGVDRSQYSRITMKTNAATYKIDAELKGKTDGSIADKLCLAGANCTDAGTFIAGNPGDINDDNSLTFKSTLVQGGATAAAPGTHTAQAGDTKFNGPSVVAPALTTGYTNGDDIVVDYDLDVDYTTQAGSYEGMIILTAVPAF